MAADGSIVIDTKIDDSGIPKQLGKMKTSLAKAAKTLALPIAITAGAIAAVGKVVSLMGELNKIYMVQASAERALSQAAANNPYLTGESVNNLKRYASELQKVSNYGDEVTIGLMTQLAAAGRTESEIQSIIKASADLAASGTTTFDGAVKNLNKTYSGLSGELGEVIPELKTLTAEQMKNGDAVDLIAKKYAGMALSVVDKTTQATNAMGDLKEQMGRGLSPVVDGLSGLFGSLAAKMAEALSAANDLRDAEKAIDSGTATAQDKITVLENSKKAIENEMATLIAYDELGQKIYTQAYKDKQAEINAIDTQIKSIQILSEYEAKLAKEKTFIKNLTEADAKADEAAAIKSKEKTDALIKAYSEWEKAQARANKAAEMGVTTQDEQMQELKRAAQEYQEKLVDITLQYGALGEALTEAFNKAQGITKDPVIPRGSPIGGPVMPTGTSSTTISMILDLIAAANDGGDAAGKALTNSMASSLDNTSIGVSEAIGGIVSNIGAAITTAIAVVKKIFAGIKAVAKFDPQAMYDSFVEILTGLTDFFAKIGSLPIYIEAGKKVLLQFMEGMLENREANMETFRNVLTYMIKAAKEVLPAVISFAFIMMTDMATAIIENLPLILETAFAIIGALEQGILEALPSLLTAAIQVLPEILTFIVSSLPFFTTNLTGMIPEIITALLTAVIENLPAFYSAIQQNIITNILILPATIIASLLLMLAEIFINILTPAEDGGKSIVTAMGEGFANSWEAFGDGIVELFGTLWERLLEVGEKGEEIGKALLEGIKKGIENTWVRLLDIVDDVINSVIDGVKTMLGIHSPSTVFAGFGVNLMDGLKNAILGYDLWGKISGKFTDLLGKVKGVVSTVGGVISGVVSGVGGVISGAVSGVGDWVKGLFNAEGTNNFRGGTAIINEEGAEMVTLPSGSKVMTASATAQMQDRAISQLLAGMKTPTFAVAGSGGNRNINISTKVDAPLMVDGSVLGRLVFQNIDRAVI